MGGWAAAPLLGSVALVDFLRYGPYAGRGAAGWLCWRTCCPAGCSPTSSASRWGERRIGRRAARGRCCVGGAALFAALLLVFHYPASMVGVPGADRTNSHPPSLLVLALAAASPVRRSCCATGSRGCCARPALWAPVVVVNLCAMTILCWHQTAMLSAAVPGSFLGSSPG